MNLDEIVARCDVLAADFALRAGEHDRGGTFPHENVAALRAASLPAMTVPGEYGGWGAGIVEMTLGLQHLARGDASTALGVAMHVHVIGQLAEQRLWSPDAFERLCRETVAHGALVNNVASEPDMGSPSRGGLPASYAERVPGGFHISGRKSWVTFAPALTYFLVSARLDGADGRPTLGVFGVHGDSPGITVRDNWRDALSLRASGSSDVEFDRVFVPDAWLVEARDPSQTHRGKLPAAWSTCSFAAVYLGVGEAALQHVAAYAKARIPTALGKPIAELPHIQRACGQIETVLHAARAVLHATASHWAGEPGQRAGMAAELALTKHLCTNAAIQATDLAMRAAGAHALEGKLPLERLLRDARAGLLHPPQDEAALELIGRTVLFPARS